MANAYVYSMARGIPQSVARVGPGDTDAITRTELAAIPVALQLMAMGKEQGKIIATDN